MGSFWGGVSWGLPGASWGFSGASILRRLGRCGWRSCPVVVVSGGCLRPVVVRLGGACVQQSWPGRALVSGRLFDGRCVGRPRGGMPLGGTLCGGGFLGAFWGFLGPPGKHPESTRKATLFVSVYVCLSHFFNRMDRLKSYYALRVQKSTLSFSLPPCAPIRGSRN